MNYFTFSPLDMDQHSAYELARPLLNPAHIVDVSPYYVTPRKVPSGTRPQALPNTYLVRVEQDGSLRIVHKALE